MNSDVTCGMNVVGYCFRLDECSQQ